MSGLSSAEQHAFDDARALLSEQGPVSAREIRALTRYARAVVLAERLWSAIPARSLTSPGSRGNRLMHPAVKAALEAERAAVEFGQALGIEPRAEHRAGGRPIGAASAPDRSAGPPRLRMTGEPPRLSRPGRP